MEKSTRVSPYELLAQIKKHIKRIH